MHPPAPPRGLRDRLTDYKKELALELPGPVIGDLPLRRVKVVVLSTNVSLALCLTTMKTLGAAA